MKKLSDKQILEALNGKNDDSMNILKSQEKTTELAQISENKLGKLIGGNNDINKIADDISTLIDIVKSYAKGEYREIPFKSMLAIVSALVYFVSPIDIIPDAIPGIGHIDDALVINLAIGLVRCDLDDYRKWKYDR